jgi:hypothetical protein
MFMVIRGAESVFCGVLCADEMLLFSLEKTKTVSNELIDPLKQSPCCQILT